MPGHLRLACPQCQRSNLRIRAEYLGKRAVCKRCGHEFIARSASEPAQADETIQPILNQTAARHLISEPSRVAPNGSVSDCDTSCKRAETQRRRSATRIEEFLARIEAVERDARERLEAASSHFATELAALRDDIDRRCRESESLKRDRQAALKQLEDTCRELSHSQAETERLTWELNEARREIESATRRSSESVEEIRRLQTVLGRERQECEVQQCKLRGELDSLRTELEQCRREADAARQDEDEPALRGAEAGSQHPVENQPAPARPRGEGPARTPMVRLRPDLKVIRVSPTDFHILDPKTHDSFKMGADERYLLFLMERLSSPDEVVRAFANRFGRVLEKRPLLEFAEQLAQSGLLTAASDAGNGASRGPIHA